MFALNRSFPESLAENNFILLQPVNLYETSNIPLLVKVICCNYRSFRNLMDMISNGYFPFEN